MSTPGRMRIASSVRFISKTGASLMAEWILHDRCPGRTNCRPAPAAARFERHASQQIAALQAELAMQGARAETASDLRAERARRAALEAALAEEASKPVRPDAAFADTEPLDSWRDTQSTREFPFIVGG